MGEMMHTHLSLAPRLGISGSLPLLPLYAFMDRDNFTFLLLPSIQCLFRGKLKHGGWRNCQDLNCVRNKIHYIRVDPYTVFIQRPNDIY